MYDSVFSKAWELGREQELFGLTKEQKEFYDTTEAYHRAMDESEIVGDDANIAPFLFVINPKAHKNQLVFQVQNFLFHRVTKVTI